VNKKAPMTGMAKGAGYQQRASVYGSPIVFKQYVGNLYTAFFLLQKANPARPLPRRSMVDGSGTGAVP